MRPVFELFEQMNWVVTVQHGKDLRYVYVNDQARRLVGGRDLIGRTVLEAFPTVDQVLLRKVRHTLRAGRPFVGTEEPITVDWKGTGEIETRFLTFFCQAIRGMDSPIEYVVMFASDVTDRVTENVANKRWRDAALNAVRTPILIVDPDPRTILFANQAAIKLVGSGAVGSTIGRALGLHASSRLTDSDGRPISTENGPVVRASRGEVVGPVELIWHTEGKSLSLVCFAERIAPVKSEPPAVVVSLFDVTHLSELRDELARAENARDDFVQLVAHELRTPLTSLRLQVEAARRKHSDLPGIMAVSNAVERMTKRVEQLIDVADMREQRVTLHPERSGLLDITRDAVRLLEPEARWSKSVVTIEDAPRTVGTWDRRRVTQVIASLLSNAMKFGANKAVELVVRDEGPNASVSVVDHGVGVDPSDRELIFARYQRRASPAHFGGLGLDLWIAKELVHNMGGEIEVGDTPGGGATFTIHVPKEPG